jgi:short-subunit dehydrogenase
MSGKIIITGAGKGIGRAMAFMFAEKGFDLALCARTKSDLGKLKSEIEFFKPGCQIITQVCDVSDKEQLQAFAETVLTRWNGVDILVNNAGVFLPGQVINEKEGTLEQLIETNLYSAYRLSRHIAPVMMAKRKGHIFNVCSIASLNAYPNGGSYSISKFAMLGLSKALREELKPFNVRVTSLLPGATYTDSWSGSDLPEARFMKAEDIAQIVYDIYSLSANTVVEEIVLRPVLGDI